MGLCGAGLEARGEERTDTNVQERAVVTADFGKWVDYPLVKSKFSAYNSGYVPGHVDTYRRDIKLFDEVRPDSLRFDGGLGSPRYILLSIPPMVSGTPSDLEYDFRQADQLLDLLSAHGVDAYWCYSYVPECLVGPGQDFRHPPSDMGAWERVISAVAGHFHESGRAIAYHEIYNEPDNRDFFVGSRQDYLAMYGRAARAIRAVDPEARVGGPSLAFSDSWVEPFLDCITGEQLPLDFFSFHYYPGVPYSAPNVQGVVSMVRHELGRRPHLATTEMHLNEYNSLPINYPEDGPQQKHGLAAALLSDYCYFVSQPCLTKVHWAQFMDTGGSNWSGMISIDGRRKAVFNAYRIYAMMPVDRRAVSVDGPPGLGGMASSDDHRSGVVVWNRSGAAQPVKLSLSGVPFARGDVRIYRIDSQHASWGDNPANEDLAPVEVRTNIDMRDANWAGDIPDGGVVYIQADDGTRLSELAPSPTAKVVRVLHYYPDRSKRCYADFDRNTWIARLGMAGEEWADAEVGVVAQGLPRTLAVSMQVDGELRKLDSNSLLGIRLDYHAGAGYTRSVLFHGPYSGGADLYSSRRWVSHPWGTKQTADEVVSVPDCARFDIPVLKHAPPGWSGRAVITFILQNAGPTVRAKIALRRAD